MRLKIDIYTLIVFEFISSLLKAEVMRQTFCDCLELKITSNTRF